MYIYILPVSGGRFPQQLGHLKVLGNAGYKPDLVMSCSGGNIVAYVGLYANWDITSKQDMVLQHLYGLINIESWNSPMFKFIPDILMLLNKGSIFKNIGDVNPFRRSFNKETIKETEIWTSAYNRLHDKLGCFCNLNKSEAIINSEKLLDDTTLMPLVYLDGDIDQLYLVCKASASIPAVFPQVWINDMPYNDGGVACASPFVSLCPAVQNLMLTKPIHFIYFNPRPLYQNNVYDGDKAITNIFLATRNLSRFGIHADLSLIKSIMVAHGEVHHKYIQYATINDLTAWDENNKNYKHSLMEISPKSINEISILNMDRTEISAMMEESSENFALRQWWVLLDEK